MNYATANRVSRMRKAQEFGAAQGASYLFLSLVLGATLFWALSQVGGLLAGLLAAGAVLMLLGTGGDLTRGFGELSRGLFTFSDTRNRVLAMEEYHGIEYVEIPGERMYLKEGERADLVIYGKNGRIRARREVHRNEAAGDDA